MLADRRLTWGEDRVYYYDKAGALRRLPACWTSIGTSTLFEKISAGRSHFRIQDLLQLVSLIAQQRKVQPLKDKKRRQAVSIK